MAVHGIIGKKVGMTQIFTTEGTVVPVTVVQAGPCLVVQKKTADKDGYDALQIGFVGPRPDRRANQAAKGRFEKAGVAPMRTLMEVQADTGDELKPGDKLLCTRSSGRLGGRQSTTKNLVVVRVDLEKNLLYISGPVPGARNSIVKIVRSSFAKKA